MSHRFSELFKNRVGMLTVASLVPSQANPERFAWLV